MKLLTQFIPPLLQVSASPVLSILLREVKEQLTARGRELALYKQDRGLENIALGARDMVYLLALLTLNRNIPLLHHLLDDGSTHPWQFYGVLRQIAGELSTFSTGHDVFGVAGTDKEDELPPYQHDNLGACFGAAVTLIVKLLDELTAGPDYLAPLLFDGTYYGADITERAFQGVVLAPLGSNAEWFKRAVQRIVGVGQTDVRPVWTLPREHDSSISLFHPRAGGVSGHIVPLFSDRAP